MGRATLSPPQRKAIVLTFSSENPEMLESSNGQKIDVFVRKQGRNWSFGTERRSGEHSSPRGSIVHVLGDAIVSHGSVDDGWAKALCGSAPCKGGGWQLLATSSNVTCKKCQSLHRG